MPITLGLLRSWMSPLGCNATLPQIEGQARNAKRPRGPHAAQDAAQTDLPAQKNYDGRGNNAGNNGRAL